MYGYNLDGIVKFIQLFGEKCQDMNANIIYDNNKDRDLIETISVTIPIFINFIDFNTVQGRKEAYKIKSHWAARKNPFVEVLNEDDVNVFYSDDNSNAIIKFINWLNNDSKN